MKRIFLLFFLYTALAASAQKYSPDNNFDTDGYWFSNLPGDDRGYDVGVQADGKIVTAGGIGRLSNPSDARCIVSRLNPDGSPDASFGNNGTVEFKFDNQSSVAYALDLQTDGKIVIVARVATERIGVARLLPDGKFDPGFHKTGTHVLPVPTLYFESDETPMDITHQDDGKIVVAFSLSHRGGFFGGHRCPAA